MPRPHLLFSRPIQGSITGLFALLLGVCANLLPAVDAASAKHVIVAPVVAREISDRVEALGTAKANESVTITSSVTEKISRIGFEDGAQVKAGDVLLELDQSEELAILRQAEALRGERELALNRQLQLQKQKLAAADEIDRIRLELEQARANISAIKTRIADRVIRAPFDGIVGLRNISVGALVETGDPVVTLDDLSRIKLDFSVPAVFLSELRPGLRIEARSAALPGKVFAGRVSSINSRVDPVSRSIQVRAQLPNPDRALIPGLLLQVELLRNTREALVIPEAALIPQAEQQYVFVRVSAEGKDSVEKRSVKIGLRSPGFVEVLEGLSDGEQVVTHGNDKIRPGDALDILAVDDGSIDIATILKQPTKQAADN